MLLFLILFEFSITAEFAVFGHLILGGVKDYISFRKAMSDMFFALIISGAFDWS